MHTMAKKPRRVSTARKVKDYDDRPGISYASHSLYTWRNNPPFVRFLHVPAMQRDSRLTLALKVLKGMALSLSRFYVEPNDTPSKIKDFVVQEVERFWTVGASHMVDAMDWGWAGGEVLYKYDSSGELHFDAFQKFRAMDIQPVTLDGNFAGIELKTQGKKYIGGQYAFWHVYEREFNRWWGRSIFESAFLPWHELHDKNGALDMRRMFYYKHSFQGKTGRFPSGGYTDETTGAVTPNRDILVNLMQNHRSGGDFALPSDRDENGDYLWDIEHTTTSQSAHDVREYVDDLYREETEGIGVSQELIMAADTGSGYSGRKIPEQSVRGILSQEVFWMIYDFDQQVIRPMIQHNFGQDADYQIKPFGLVEEEPIEPEGQEAIPGQAVDQFRKQPNLRVA